jgi:hypothetical protein
MQTIQVRLPARKQAYEIRIGSGLLRELGNEVRACLGADVRRIALISNKTVSICLAGSRRAALKNQTSKRVIG